jgi:cell division protease FtsH
VVGLLALALFQMMSRQRNPTQEFSYTEFSRQLDQGNIARVEVFDGKRLEGDFRAPVTQDGRTAKSFTVLLPVANSESFIKRLEDAGVPILAKEPKGGITAIIIAALPWIVILGLWFFLLRQLQAGGSRAFAFGKSKAKLLAGDTPKVTFADVAGADEAKVELQEIIEFLKDPQKFTRLGGRLPKGALLVGPPGTGKTAPTSWRCSWASVPAGCATSSSRGSHTRPASSSSTRSTRWAATAARVSAADTTSGSRR